jgi:pimeloyl-ACP methyl ester carboxylesterase
MTDAVIAFEKFVEVTGDKPKFILGRSIGGFAASHLYTHVEPGRIAGFMIECGVSDSVALINRHHSADHQMQMQSISYISPNANYARGSAPILFIHGSADRLVRPSESEVAFDQIKTTHKHLKIIDGAGHKDLWQFEDYWTAINQFIENQLK